LSRQREDQLPQAASAHLQNLPDRRGTGEASRSAAFQPTRTSRVMTLLLDPQQRSTRPVWHVYFSHTLRYVLAPLLFISSGFFTANFIVSGHYTWPRTSRVFVLTLTLLILAYEFIYKDHTVRSTSPERAFNAVLYSCMIPYALGVLMMLGLAKL
jgi:hypothetical protein